MDPTFGTGEAEITSRLSERPSRGRMGFDALLTSGVILGLGLFSNLAVARGLGPSGKGVFDLLVASGAVLSLVLSLQLPIGVTYVVARERGVPRSLRPRMALFALAQSVAAGLVLWVAFRWFGAHASFGPARLGVSTWVAGALVAGFVALGAISSLWRALLVGRQQIIRVNRRDLLVRTVQVGLVVTVVVAGAALGGKAKPAAVYASTVLAALFAAVLYLASTRRTERAAISGREGFGQAVRFSIPAYLANLVQMANYRLDLFFLAALATYAAVGRYALAVALSQLVWLVPEALALVLLPATAASQDDIEANAARAARGARLALWGGLVVGVAIAVSGWVLVPLLFPGFRESAVLLLWLIPGSVLLSPATVMASFVAGMGRPRLNLMVSSAGLVVTLLLDITLIPGMGATGAALASSLSYATSAVLMAVVVRRLGHVGTRELTALRVADIRAAVSAARETVWRGQGR